MTVLLLEPHQDDAVLWSCFNAIRHQAHVVTVLRSTLERERENGAAFADIGLTWDQWPEPADAPDWAAVSGMMRVLATGAWDLVFAPWPEDGGHPDHNRLGEMAREVFGDLVTYYTTYRYGGPRTTGTPVPYEPEWILRKLKALACYESQILRGPRRFWMMGLDEYTRDIVAQP